MLIAIARRRGRRRVFTGVQWAFVHDNGPYQASRQSGRKRRHGRGRRVRGVREVGDPRRDVARAVAVRRLPAARAPRGSRVLRAHAVLGHRHDADGVGERPHHRSSCRSRSCRSRCTCSPRSTAGALASQEAGLKYFLLGSFSSAVFLYGVALVYGGDRHDEPHRHRDVPRDDRAPPRRRAAGRHRVPARRARLQGRGRAVPHVDARRVPGRAHAGHRVHGVGDEGGRVRGDAAHLRRRVPALRASTGGRSSSGSPCSRCSSAASPRSCRPT